MRSDTRFICIMYQQNDGGMLCQSDKPSIIIIIIIVKLMNSLVYNLMYPLLLPGPMDMCVSNRALPDPVQALPGPP